MLSKNEIFAANDITTEEFEVPEWGGSIYLKSMSVGEIELYQRYAQKMEDAAEPNLVAFLVTLVACDEKGTRLFSGQEDVVKLAAKSGKVISRIAEAATKLNGLGEDAFEEEVKN